MVLEIIERYLPNTVFKFCCLLIRFLFYEHVGAIHIGAIWSVPSISVTAGGWAVRFERLGSSFSRLRD